MNSKVLVKLLAGLLCYCYFFNPVLAQQTAPDDPNDMVTGESYITDNLVEDHYHGPDLKVKATVLIDLMVMAHGEMTQRTGKGIGILILLIEAVRK